MYSCSNTSNSYVQNILDTVEFVPKRSCLHVIKDCAFSCIMNLQLSVKQSVVLIMNTWFRIRSRGSSVSLWSLISLTNHNIYHTLRTRIFLEAGSSEVEVSKLTFKQTLILNALLPLDSSRVF